MPAVSCIQLGLYWTFCSISDHRHARCPLSVRHEDSHCGRPPTCVMPQCSSAALLSEIMEVEPLRLAFFIVSDDQISSGWGISLVFRVADLLTLRLALLFLSSFVQPCPFFLSLREGGARASCHKNSVYVLFDSLLRGNRVSSERALIARAPVLLACLVSYRRKAEGGDKLLTNFSCGGSP